MNIALQRLYTQRLAGPKFETAGDAVRWFGAVQAQDYQASLWAIGLRVQDATEKLVEQAVADREIVRTWPMRGTLHFVPAADIRWMLELLTPRVLAGSVRLLHRQLELDKKVFAQAKKVFENRLAGGRRLTRPALYEALEAKGISVAGGRGIHILAQLAQEGWLCFGPRDGKQITLALLEEWVPDAKRLPRDEALAELALRYFASHGPATELDFRWWAGLAAADARAAVELAAARLLREEIAGQIFWFASAAPAGKPATVQLLPVFDEYTVAYKDRTAALSAEYASRKDAGNGLSWSMIDRAGQIVGTWKRTVKKDAVRFATNPFRALGKAESLAFSAAARRYGAFLGLPVVSESRDGQ